MNSSFALRLAANVKFVVGALLLGCLGLVAGCGDDHAAQGALISISIAPPTPNVAVGVSTQFSATGLYSDGSKKNISTQVTWASSTAPVASISASGLSKALSVGTSSISATVGAVFGRVTLTVSPAMLASVQVTPTAPSIAVGSTQQFSAAGIYTDGTTQDLTASATWTSTQTGVATISNTAGSNGLATPLAPGTTTITATFNGVTGSTDATITGAALVSIAVTPPTATLAKGVTQALVATGTYSDNTTQDLTAVATWTSSDPTIVSVAANGTGELATAVAPGMATITATMGAITGTSSVTVTAAALVSIGIAPPAPSIGVGANQQFTAMGTYTDGSTQSITALVTWASSNVAVATISNAANFDGLAHAVSVGNTMISATLGAVTASTTFTVTAATLVSIGVTPAAPTIAKGSTQQFVATGVYTDNSMQVLTNTATWASSVPAVATISNSAPFGLATGLTAGATVITATVGAVVSTPVTLTVTPATLVSIAITPVNPSIAKGLTQQFSAIGTYSDATTQDVTATATWTSATPATATISNLAGSNGLATSVAPGTTVIRAASGAVTSNAQTLTVTAAALVSIAVTPAAPSIAKGTVQQFVATGTYTDATTQVLTTTATWASATVATATISNTAPNKGKATSVAVGTTVITAAQGGITSPGVTLTVTPADLVSIAVTPAAPHIFVNNTLQFTATGTYTDATTQVLTTTTTWASATMATATISNAAGTNGLATALAVGTTSITAASTAMSGAVITSPAVTLTVSATEYAYAVNFIEGTISQYTVGVNGVLAPMTPATLPTGVNPYAFDIDPSHHFLYVVNNLNGAGGNSVTEFTIAANGSLTAVAPNVATGSTPNGITVDPSGTHAYVANFGDGTVSQYTITPTTGVLVPMTPATVSSGTAGSEPASVTINAARGVAYVPNYGDGTVAVFSISPTTGALTLNNLLTVTVGATTQVDLVLLDPTGAFAYVSSPGTGGVNKVFQYSVSQTTGGLTPLAPASVTLAGDPHSITLGVLPGGGGAPYLYAPQLSNQSVARFSIGNTGLLSLAATTTVAAGSGPNKVGVDPSGQYAYVAERNAGVISQFGVGAAGALTPLTPTTVVSGTTAGPQPTWILVTTTY